MNMNPIKSLIFFKFYFNLSEFFLKIKMCVPHSGERDTIPGTPSRVYPIRGRGIPFLAHRLVCTPFGGEGYHL